MIIVSQDKELIVNYENIEVLGIGNPLENNNAKFGIIANVISDNQYILGEYKTEERAKEVLQEIIKTNSNFGYYKCVNESERDGLNPLMKTKYKFFDVYEIPEE